MKNSTMWHEEETLTGPGLKKKPIIWVTMDSVGLPYIAHINRTLGVIMVFCLYNYSNRCKYIQVR